MKSGTKALVAIVAYIAVIPWVAYVATVMWGWFVVPLGMPAIGKAHAYGLLAIAGLIRRGESSKKADPAGTRDVIVAIGIAFSTPALVLFVGWLAHKLMT